MNPIVFTYRINEICNFNCSYCFYRKCGKEAEGLDTKDIFKLLQIIRKEGSILYINGGEPLLRKDIVDVLKFAKDIGFRSISIVTNMSLIHKKMEAGYHNIRWNAKNQSSGIYLIEISADGFSTTQKCLFLK